MRDTFSNTQRRVFRAQLQAILTAQAAQAHYVWVRALEVIWLEYTRIISVLSDAT